MKEFQTGRLVFTRGVNDRVAEDLSYSKFVLRSLSRHAQGDWGELCEEDKQENEWALKVGERLFSAYTYEKDDRIWIITERDRSATTVLLPEEY